MNTFGNYIKQLRNGISIRESAKNIGISHTYLDSLEKGFDIRTNGKRSPSVVTVYKIAKYYNVEIEKLCEMIITDINN